LRKIVLSISVSAILLTNANANFIEDNVISVGNDAGYYETQIRGIYSLGSQSIKYRDVGTRIQPVNIQIPRMSQGCGGIDYTMGGFSYLKPEYLIEKLKAMSAAAPAFVYQMAISSLCKDCQNILNELEKMSQMVNGMGLDSCTAISAAQNLGRVVGEGMNQNINSGQSDSWLTEKLKSANDTMTGWKNSLTATFGGDSAKANDAMELIAPKGSLLHIAATKGLPEVSKLDILGNDPNGDKLILSSFRAVVGDFLGTTTDDGTPQVIFDPGGTTVDFFKKIYEGGKLKYTSYNHTTKKIIGSGEFELQKGAKDIIKDKLVQIYNKMKSKQALTNDDKKFLSTLSFPVYKILNVSVVGGTGNLDFDIIASQIAAEQTKELIYYMTSLVARGFSNYISANGKDLPTEAQDAGLKLNAKINELDQQARNYVITINDEIQTKRTLLTYVKQREQEMKARLSTYSFYNSGY